MDEFKRYFLVIVALLIFFWIIPSCFEMKAFNRHSETKATLIEAMFANLRINAK